MKIYRLREAKTSQLRKLLNNGNITEEQFNIADEFFKKYSAFEKEIDWNRGLKITWDDLKEVIYKDRSSSKSQTKKKIRKGLEGFEEGKDYKVLEETAQGMILITLKYGEKKERVITGLKRISKSGLRVYAKSNEIPRVLNGLGIAIISTSKGLMTDKEARNAGLGGEVLAYIW